MDNQLRNSYTAYIYAFQSVDCIIDMFIFQKMLRRISNNAKFFFCTTYCVLTRPNKFVEEGVM
jgi:hypothetical protein